MDRSASRLWWTTAGVLVAAELSSGSFYLLMLPLGAAAGAAAAHMGVGGTGQVLAAALFGGGATALWHFMRARQPPSAPAQTNRDVVIDIGQPVRVEQWAPDGQARVQYRGASWAARWAGSGPPTPGGLRIVAVQGSGLQVAPPSPP